MLYLKHIRVVGFVFAPKQIFIVLWDFVSYKELYIYQQETIFVFIEIMLVLFNNVQFFVETVSLNVFGTLCSRFVVCPVD